MIGKDIFEDIGIDAIQYEIEMKDTAKLLIDHHGKDITEADLLRLNGMVQSDACNIENILAAECLEYYLTQDYTPERIDVDKFSTSKNPWWKFW